MRFIVVLIYCLLIIVGTGRSQTRVIFEKTGSQQFHYPSDSLEHFVHFGQYDAIIFGETHTANFEPRFKYQLIKQLNKEQGIRDVFMEIGHSAAYVFNHFLATGDTSLFQYLHIVYSPRNAGYKPFWDSLYHYNKTRSPGQKVIIHGIDFERTEVFTVLLALKPAEKPVPAELQPAFELMKEFANAGLSDHFDKEFVNKFNELRMAMLANRALVMDYYGANSGIVNSIINNNGPHTSGTPKRNKSMFRNMKQLVEEKKIERFAAFFGSAHTSYKVHGTMPNRIQGISGFEGKTMVINSVYFNAYSPFSKKILPYVGGIKSKGSQELHDKYMTPENRAVLLRCSDVENASLKGSADFVLLVNDGVD